MDDCSSIKKVIAIRFFVAFALGSVFCFFAPATQDINAQASRFQNAGGVKVASVPGIAAQSDNLYVVAQGIDNNRIYYNRWTASLGWLGWVYIGGATVATPAVAILGDTLHAVVRGTDNGIFYKKMTISTGTWDKNDWFNLGGAMLSAPAMAASNNRIDLVIRGTDNNIYHRYWTPSGWSANWVSLNGQTTDTPALAAFGGILHLIVRGTDDTLYYKKMDLSTGSWDADWTALDKKTISAPMLSAINGKLDLLIRGENNEILRDTWTAASGWPSAFETIPGATNSTPAMAGSNNNVYLFARGTDNGIYFFPLTSSGWGQAFSDGATSDAPASTSSNGYLYLIVRGTDNVVYSATLNLDTNQWWAPSTICSAGTVNGCRICEPDGSGWADDGTKCGARQTCSNGACVNDQAHNVNGTSYDAVVCRGTSAPDDIAKQSTCTYVCKSTDADCQSVLQKTLGRNCNNKKVLWMPGVYPVIARNKTTASDSEYLTIECSNFTLDAYGAILNVNYVPDLPWQRGLRMNGIGAAWDNISINGLELDGNKQCADNCDITQCGLNCAGGVLCGSNCMGITDSCGSDVVIKDTKVKNVKGFQYYSESGWGCGDHAVKNNLKFINVYGKGVGINDIIGGGIFDGIEVANTRLEQYLEEGTYNNAFDMVKVSNLNIHDSVFYGNVIMGTEASPSFNVTIKNNEIHPAIGWNSSVIGNTLPDGHDFLYEGNSIDGDIMVVGKNTVAQKNKFSNYKFIGDASDYYLEGYDYPKLPTCNSFMGGRQIKSNGKFYTCIIGSGQNTGSWQNALVACNSNAVVGCRVCNANGTVWVDTDSKCASGQVCANGQCVVKPTCAPNCSGKTCGDDGCFGSCGTCSSGKTCNASGQCVGSGGSPAPVASSNRSGGGGGGGTINSPVQQQNTNTPVKQLTRVQILAKIAQIKQLLIQLIIQLIAELQKQLAASGK